MENQETNSETGSSEDIKSFLSSFIKNEVKRKIVGETYTYLIKIPSVVFWISTIVSTAIILTLEILIAGIVYKDQFVRYSDVLIGFCAAVAIGLLVGKIYSSRVSKKVHSQIADILRLKPFENEN